MRWIAVVPFFLAAACGGSDDAPPAPASATPAPPIAAAAPAAAAPAGQAPAAQAPAAPAVQCVASPAAHATAEALRVYRLPREEVGEPDVTSLDYNLDVDGDGRPEIVVDFVEQFGAYQHRIWLYGTAGSCTRFLGSFETSFLWPGIERHGGVLDLLVLYGLDDPHLGAGLMRRLQFDGSQYVIVETLQCSDFIAGAPRDPRCPVPSADGASLPVRAESWAAGGAPTQAPSPPAAPTATAPAPGAAPTCVQPEQDARANATGELRRTDLPDIDGDGQPDVAYLDTDRCGSGGCDYDVYISHGGCAVLAGDFMGGEPQWDPVRRELGGGFWQGDPCRGSSLADTQPTSVWYRVEGTRLVVARRQDPPPCP